MKTNKDIKSIDETPNEEKWRMISILSYVIVLIAFGLPIWWFTTRVYRATLPLEEMLELNAVSLKPLNVQISSNEKQRGLNLKQDLIVILGATVNLSLVDVTINLPQNEDDTEIEFSVKDVDVAPGNILLIEWPRCSHEFVITSQRVIFFNGDVNGDKLAALLQKWPGVDLKTALVSPSQNEDVDTLRAFPAGPNYDVLITVVNPDPKSTKINWDFLQALSLYIKPFLQKLEPVSNFTIKSQWLYFVDLGVKPRQVGAHYALAEQLLPHIITPLEKKLSSHVSKNPCINFVIYVPPCTTSPVHIYTKKGVRSSVDAFISPRWGGIQIANPNCTTATTFTPNTQHVMSIITTQLTQLLGLLGNVKLRQTGLRPSKLQVDFMQRRHTIEYLTNSKLTLKSLAQLLSEISNIVINDDVALSVQNAVDNIKRAERAIKVEDVFRCSKEAAVSSESAFTDPSLLALLYFPDDQKYAVYIPLFLPIMIPVIMSMKQLLQYSKKPKK